MPSNDFLSFAGGSGANVLSQADYAALTAILSNGFSSGVAQSLQVNKVLRQSSIMSAVLAQFVVDATGQNAVDDGTTATLLTNLKSAVTTASRQSSIQQISGSVAGNALTLTLNAAILDFRSATAGSGAINAGVKISSPISLVVPSGATLGTVSGTQAMLAVLVAYNAGTPVLCVANVAGGADLSETGLISPTTIGAGSNSASAIYSASAVAANSPFRVVGYIQITEAAAGTWATAPTLVQGVGGQALAALQSFGFGQTEQDITASRAIGTTYYNTTSRPILVSVALATTAANQSAIIAVNGVNFPGSSYPTSGFSIAVTAIVRPGSSYSVPSGSYTLAFWRETR